MSMNEWLELKAGDKIKWIGGVGESYIYEIELCVNGWHPYQDYCIFNPNGIQCLAYSAHNWALISKAKVL